MLFCVSHYFFRFIFYIFFLYQFISIELHFTSLDTLTRKKCKNITKWKKLFDAHLISPFFVFHTFSFPARLVDVVTLFVGAIQLETGRLVSGCVSSSLQCKFIDWRVWGKVWVRVYTKRTRACKNKNDNLRMLSSHHHQHSVHRWSGKLKCHQCKILMMQCFHIWNSHLLHVSGFYNWKWEWEQEKEQKKREKRNEKKKIKIKQKMK